MRLRLALCIIFGALAFLLLSCAAPPAPIAASANSTATQPVPTIKIGHNTWVGFGPLYIAQEKGFFAEEGVNVELIVMEDAKSRFVALAAGQIEANGTTLDEMTIYYKPENRFKAVVLVDDSRGADGVIADGSIADIAGLAGKKVAFQEGSISNFYIAYLLNQAGLTLQDVEAVNMGAGDAGAAFVAERVDAAVTWEPWLSQGKERADSHILTDTSETPGLIVDALVFSDEFIASHPEAVQGVVNGYYKAMDFYASNPDEALALMAAGVGGWLADVGEYAATLEGVKLYTKADNTQLAQNGSEKAAVQFAIDFWRTQGMITDDFAADDLITNVFQ